MTFQMWGTSSSSLLWCTSSSSSHNNNWKDGFWKTVSKVIVTATILKALMVTVFVILILGLSSTKNTIADIDIPTTTDTDTTASKNTTTIQENIFPLVMDLFWYNTFQTSSDSSSSDSSSSSTSSSSHSRMLGFVSILYVTVVVLDVWYIAHIIQRQLVCQLGIPTIATRTTQPIWVGDLQQQPPYSGGGEGGGYWKRIIMTIQRRMTPNNNNNNRRTVWSMYSYSIPMEQLLLQQQQQQQSLSTSSSLSLSSGLQRHHQYHHQHGDVPLDEHAAEILEKAEAASAICHARRHQQRNSNIISGTNGGIGNGKRIVKGYRRLNTNTNTTTAATVIEPPSLPYEISLLTHPRMAPQPGWTRVEEETYNILDNNSGNGSGSGIRRGGSSCYTAIVAGGLGGGGGRGKWFFFFHYILSTFIVTIVAWILSYGITMIQNEKLLLLYNNDPTTTVLTVMDEIDTISTIWLKIVLVGYVFYFGFYIGIYFIYHIRRSNIPGNDSVCIVSSMLNNNDDYDDDDDYDETNDINNESQSILTLDEPCPTPPKEAFNLQFPFATASAFVSSMGGIISGGGGGGGSEGEDRDPANMIMC